jgi:hypothetical protein
VFSPLGVQAAYRCANRWIERAMGTVLIGPGAQIVVQMKLWKWRVG